MHSLHILSVPKWLYPTKRWAIFGLLYFLPKIARLFEWGYHLETEGVYIMKPQRFMAALLFPEILTPWTWPLASSILDHFLDCNQWLDFSTCFDAECFSDQTLLVHCLVIRSTDYILSPSFLLSWFVADKLDCSYLSKKKTLIAIAYALSRTVH